MFFWLFLTFLITSTVSQTCKLLYDIDSKRPSDPRIINAYNDVLGTIINLTYYDEAVLLSAKKLAPGALRHPGGTVGNYWSFENASYVTPCNTTNYDYCQWQQRVEAFPAQTFSPYNFYNGIANVSPLVSKYNITISFVLNLLTLNETEQLNQLNVLYNELEEKYPNSVQYFELGNEFYHDRYQYKFPNSSSYMEQVMPVINKSRELFPNIRMSAVSQLCFGNKENEWNEGLVPYISNVDAVTIHDYSCKNNTGYEKLNYTEKISYVSSYGRAAISTFVDYVGNTFGDDVKIWITEYNLGIRNDNISFSVLHSMFIMSYISSAICNSDVIELLMLHLMSTQQGTNWSRKDYAVYYSQYSNDTNYTTFDVEGQILNQIAWISMIKNNEMYCLEYQQLNNTDCPEIGVDIIHSDNLKCIFGSGFTNDKDSNSFGFMLVNSCDMDINVELQVPNELGKNVTLNIWIYKYNQSGKGAKFVDCNSNEQLWDCGPIKPLMKQKTIIKNQRSITMSIDAFSLYLATTD